MPVEGEEFCWEGRPTSLSYLGLYARALTPLLSLLFLLGLRYVAADFLAEASSMASFALKMLLPDMPPIDGVVYVFGVVISLILGIMDWLVNLNVWLVVFEVVVYVCIESIRLYLGLSLGLAGRAVLLGLFSSTWLFFIELQRRSYRYFVTRRSVVVSGGLLRRVERHVSGEAISDVIVVRPILGRLFNFGHIVVVTPSQLGLGETYSLGGGGVFSKRGAGVLVGGGRAIREVLVKPWNCIYGVKNPGRVREYILSGC